MTGSAGQAEKYGCPAKALEVHRDPFSDGFHVGDPQATLDRADFGLFHSMRSVLEYDPPTEHMGQWRNVLFLLGLAPMSLCSLWVRQTQRLTGHLMALCYPIML